MAKICIVNYCCDKCGKSMNIEFDIDMVNDRKNTSLIRQKFCLECGSRLISANNLSKVFIDKIRAIEECTEKENNEILSIKKSNSSKADSETERSRREMERLYKEKTDVGEALKKLYEEKTLLDNKIERILRENAEMEKQIMQYERRKEERKKCEDPKNTAAEKEPEQVLENLSGVEKYNALINLKKDNIDDEIAQIGGMVFLRMNANGIFEETDDNGIKCYMRHSDNDGELFEVYPAYIVKYNSGRIEYEELYHCEGEGRNVFIKDICFLRKIGDIYKTEKMGKIIFEQE